MEEKEKMRAELADKKHLEREGKLRSGYEKI